MKVIIVTWAGELSLELGLNDSVFDIKRKIEQLFGVQVASQALAVYGFELIDGLDMEDYPIIVEGTKIDLTITPLELSTKILVFVKISTRRMNIEVDRMETVGSLKEKIHIVDGAPIKRLSLFFSGIEMKEDHRCLCEYGICDQSEINVMYKCINHLRIEPTPRKLSLLVQTSLGLLNSAIIPVEVKDSSSVNDLRRMLLDEKVLPRDDCFFIHKQRIMQDNCTLAWHGVSSGDTLYVFKGTITREN
ncbi:hypothetical protein GIB67_012205 [Kingdonia uniflora]|uniref:Ubiquitin-like domain-containing protein n=1 Tax=Kingdonia uniflora TaxID=39325 RepID=A0A7J7NVA2_9MAGN|nr:hypothetical protein GIB67_012205 [Kingdonia uniflora]